jgi:hypothetical protein
MNKKAVMTVAPSKIRAAPYHITDQDTAITAADGVASTWSDVWKFRVPQNVGIVISPGDLFSAYLNDGSAEVGMDGSCLVRIEVRDASEQHRETAMGDLNYTKVREFQDKNKVFKFNPPQPFKVVSRQWIVVMVKDNTGVDASKSYFDLLCTRVSEPLG